jgi:hypothetical protein
MFYADVILLKPPVFKRLTGVPPDTFLAMCTALAQHLPKGGRPATHCLQDRLLITLMYWREYRTQAHIAQTYRLSESAVCRTIYTVETALLRSGEFTLPGKKVLTKSDIVFEVVVMDATECPVERPQKSKRRVTAAKRSTTLKKRRWSPTQKLGAF